MGQFEQATVQKKANIYYDGKVTSRTVTLQDGLKVTLGIMLPGVYEFGTEGPETMEILSGELKVRLPGAEVWQEIKGPETFHVPGNSKFALEVFTVTDYCCSYPDKL
ncbi:pyrimidine/purine nucleoside phosphorylase [Paenibacillus spiritus]|uniref:Pyrimidine/purine nucleoside phosphorylase n=1 Tax=Paenibacillus spiritus TaxID=2496557 RepID=A0A5J5GAI2_9BACL|nr:MULTISPECIES: pyrimidine/purine nucleoside phosphorylase [Paenibacillus]KAA9004940.1 pyrimidine/purine nucleoside phosphorylase [Paenibacillus spiritus]